MLLHVKIWKESYHVFQDGTAFILKSDESLCTFLVKDMFSVKVDGMSCSRTINWTIEKPTKFNVRHYCTYLVGFHSINDLMYILAKEGTRAK